MTATLSPIRLTKSDCVHYWIIEGSHDLKWVNRTNEDGTSSRVQVPNGAWSPGTCRNCQETRMFHNTLPTSNQLSI